MWVTNHCSDDRPVSAGGSLTCPTLLREKCAGELGYQPLNERNAPVCELKKFVHSVIVVLASNGGV